MCAGRGGKGRGHNLRHVTCVLSSVLLPAVCYLRSLTRMRKASDAMGISQSIPRFIPENSASREGSDNLSVYHPRLRSFWSAHLFHLQDSCCSGKC